MTATFIVQTGCSTQTSPFSWSGSSTLTLGSVKEDNMSIDTGLNTYVLPFSHSTETIAQNLAGMSTQVRITGWFSGTAAARKTFRTNIKLIAIYQQSVPGTNSTFLYKNTLSDDNIVSSTGIRVKMSNLKFNKGTRDGIGYVIWSCNLMEVKNE